MNTVKFTDKNYIWYNLDTDKPRDYEKFPFLQNQS